MEALTFMKFWLTNTTVHKPRRETRISLEDPVVDLFEGDDSFFELEISLSDISSHKNKTPEEKQTTTFSVSKSKVTPFAEPTSKPQSPTTPLLNPGRKFHPFSFKKKENNKNLNETSFRKTTTAAKSQLKPDTMFSEDSVSSVSSVSSSKRFFDLIKPLYNKTTKKQSANSVATSPTSSPATAREKQRNNIPSGIRRQLGKSRSASATLSPPAKRIDESLQVQQDGIQSAILHCKNSFHGSESYMLSRSSSESYSQEKLSTSSSEDSYLFSRLSSESMSERSYDSLTSIQEQREKLSD